jgi:mycofactocin precursor
MVDRVQNPPLSAGHPETGLEPGDQAPAHEAQATEKPSLITAELLVEDVSIDGMCGVY